MDNQILDIFKSPRKWAETFLSNPKDKAKKITFRSYQADVLDKSRDYHRMVLQFGRRTGKTVVLCADVLWWADAYPMVRMLEGGTDKEQPYTIIIATPRENHIKEIWTTFRSLIADSELLMKRVKKITGSSNNHTVQFTNGSMIKGFTVGMNPGSKAGLSLRSMSADMIFMDEMDYIPGEIVESVIMPIWTTHTDCRLRVASTPSGQRGLYYKWCKNAAELGWYHNHIPSWHQENDNWMSIEKAKSLGINITESSEYQVRAITSSERYDREYGAEFGEELGGVYKHTHIANCLKRYDRNIDLTDPDIFNPKFPQNHENLYIMGVDWNSYINGGQIVIVEYCKSPTSHTYFDEDLRENVTVDFTGKFRLFYRIGIKSKEATQRLTRSEILRLVKSLKINYIYVDYGAGDTNIEELTFYGKDFPELHLDEKLKVIDSGAVVDHYDPLLKETVKKRNKSLMVNFSVLALEEDRVILPKEEDESTRLVGQMRTYKVKNITTRGDYSYDGEDHILDAYNLAIYGFYNEYTNILNNQLEYSFRVLPVPRGSIMDSNRDMERSPIMSSSSISNIVDPEYAPIMVRRPRISKYAIGNRSLTSSYVSFNPFR